MTNNININELRDRAYKCAKAHGWHDTELSDEHFLWLTITELAEATNANRCNKRAKTEDYNSQMNYYDTQNLEPDVYNYAFKNQYSFFIKDSFEDELADACIRLFDLAGVVNANLNDIDYVNSSTEDYSELTFTESMFKIVQVINNYYEPIDIGFILNEIFEFCNDRNIDIMWYIERKMKYNELRPYKQDKLY